ncbi:hypothetical protein MKEN_01463900 [Mycena kentingensis (nom. inval.)]|nr:hypothetical protein MKEN_01463900 [Mycena kentingensis (nom. inval.)]
MHVTSLFPALPPLPDLNVYNTIFGRPDQAEWPDYTMQIDDRTGRKRTFFEVKERAGWGATALGAPVSVGGLGLQGGTDEIIGVIGFNSFEFFDLSVSLLRIAVPFALISTYSTRRELLHGLKLTKATRLFVDAKLLKNVLAAIEDPDVHISPENVYVLAGTAPKGRKSFAGMVQSVQRKKVDVEGVRPASRDTLAYLVMSSGTSGLPKAVMISHGNLLGSAMQAIVIAQSLEPFLTAKPTAAPTTIACLPMFHSYGLHVYILRATLAPATFILLEKWNTVQYLKAIPKSVLSFPAFGIPDAPFRRYKITHLILVPSLIHQVVNHPELKKTDLSSVIFVNSGAAYLPPQLFKQMSGYLQQSAEMSQGYGLSECTLSAHSRLPGGAFGIPGGSPSYSTGVLNAGMEARIVREDGTDAELGEVGELWLRGPNVALGYWNNPKANAETFLPGGWLRTGDQFSVDENGFFFFADRGKDTLKVSGVQVSPKEIEDVLFAHPDKLVSDVTVAGVSGGRTADEKIPRAWVVLSAPGRKLGKEEVVRSLERWHQEQLSRYKWLRGGIEIVREIPKTPTGKTIRRLLQDEYEKKNARKSKAKL